MYSSHYLRQVELVLKCLPALRGQEYFALKGGTAINLFMLNMPRLSVDIDLTYIPLQDRENSLLGIEAGLREIAQTIKRRNPEFIVKEQISNESQMVMRLFIYHKNVMIKIEPNSVMRGTLYPIEKHDLCAAATEMFDLSVNDIPLIKPAELYAGKFCAALSRQHPRDLFDVKMLLDTIGVTNEIRQAFVCYLVADSRPIHELLAPNLLDIQRLYSQEFKQMTETAITINTLLLAREKLIETIQQELTENERQFLLSVKQGEPNYELMPFPQLAKMPGLQWKLINVKRMDKNKHAKMLAKLRDVLMV